MNPLRGWPLVSFFALAYAWTWVCWCSALAVSSGRLAWPVGANGLAVLGQFGPFMAALAVTAAEGGRSGLGELMSSLLRWRVRPVWLGVSLILLPVTMLCAILLFASARGTMAELRFRDSWSTLPAHFVYTLLLCGPLGEEPGWRGFALPRLQVKCGSMMASLWLGLLGAGWHLPLWWLSPPPCSYPLFVVGAVLLSFLFTWLFNHTGGSVFYSLLFHTSLSVASVRLPDVPAYHLWVWCLLSVTLIVFLWDRRAGPRSKLDPMAQL
jgi:membrane protease YdiL (CAAX protease family)